MPALSNTTQHLCFKKKKKNQIYSLFIPSRPFSRIKVNCILSKLPGSPSLDMARTQKASNVPSNNTPNRLCGSAQGTPLVFRGETVKHNSTSSAGVAFGTWPPIIQPPKFNSNFLLNEIVVSISRVMSLWRDFQNGTSVSEWMDEGGFILLQEMVLVC